LMKTAEKLEKYRYNLAVAFMWPTIAMIVIGFLLTFIGLIELFSLPSSLYLLMAFLIFSSCFVVGGLYWTKIFKYQVGTRKTHGGAIFILSSLPFIVAYFVVPLLVEVSSLYYSTVWYICLALYHALNAAFVEGKLDLLVTRPMKLTAILMLATSPLPLYLNSIQMEPSGVLYASLLLTGLTLLIYLIVSLWVVIKAEAVIYRSDNENRAG